MCGIVGYTGAKPAAPILLDGLERLEYRGYDSAGIAVVSKDSGLQVQKSRGRLQALRAKLYGAEELVGCAGIGHTRWATHGEPNDVNSHPHLSEDGTVAVVHNGIIENYSELKDFLIAEGVTFRSETDTEVVAQLLQYCMKDHDDLLDTVFDVLRRLKGAYALGIVKSDAPGRIIAARKDAPLLIGHGEGESFIASDVTALLSHTRTVTYMEDGEVAVLTPDGVTFYDSSAQPIRKEACTVAWDLSAAEKGGFPHFMLKEIMEQPDAVRKTISPRMQNGRVVLEELSAHPELLTGIRHIYIVACGSSYHVGLIAKRTLEQLLKIPTEACVASEFRYSDPLIDSSTLVIVISQSGETLDTMAALREAKAQGAKTVSVVNVIGSSIARESDVVLYTWAGPEIAVATTKAYSTQLVLLTLFALYWADAAGTITAEEYSAVVDALLNLPEQMSAILADVTPYQKAADRFFNRPNAFFIGRNFDYALGMEASLKLKEISYIQSECYAAGELKHGTISLIEPGTLVIALATCVPLMEKTFSNMVEVRSRGAEVLALTVESGRALMEKNTEELLLVPETHPLLQPNLSILPMQLFSYYVADHRGCDIDKPRNLAKSVTVE